MANFYSLLFLFFIISIFIYLVKKNNSRNTWKKPKKDFPISWRKILLSNINFYNNLSITDKQLFEYKVYEFLLNCTIIGVDTEVDEKDRVLIAASAIIPIFAFPDWHYYNLKEVLLYPNVFNEEFDTIGEKRSILGMVGTGYMDGKMILSKQALHHGFINETDKKNTAIHEFVHLIDKADGIIDGIPELLLEKQYVLPWIDLIQKKIAEIYEGRSDINPYGATNSSEFFAVVSEYFFENPVLLKSKHPELYGLLEEIFDRKMAKRQKNRNTPEINRNDACPCGSRKKYKHCCGAI